MKKPNPTNFTIFNMCIMKKGSLLLLLLLLTTALFSQTGTPVNSNYLIEHGISPRTLDAAASIFMQDEE